MAEFLQSYGVLVFFGVLMALMVFGHRHGGGCGMGHHDPEPKPEIAKKEPQETEKPGSGCH
ncbi:MAG: hypothetical protein HY530_02545 [Chloroflexi bacterium]|nr:hypothetical protein [Chloroflexota bacterium]